MSDTVEPTDVIEYAVEIVAAYVSNNTVAASDLGALIGDVHRALVDLGNGAVEPEPLVPAVPIKKSVQRDHIVCLEDGKRFKTLKRHLRVHYELSPQEYREKWGLPSDYPMVAPSYSEARSHMAKSLGLGQKGRTAAAKSDGSSGTRRTAGKGATRPKAAKSAVAGPSTSKKVSTRTRKTAAKTS